MTDKHPKHHKHLPTHVEEQIATIRSHYTAELAEQPKNGKKRPLIVLDPGHGQYVFNKMYDAVPEGATLEKWYKDDRSHRFEYITAASDSTKTIRVVDDFGAVVDHKHEAIINLQIAQKLAARLEEKGFAVVLTRNAMDDIVASKYDARTGTEAGKKIMHLAIHSDYGTHTRATGPVLYYSQPTDGHAPANDLSVAFAKTLGDGNAKPHHTDLLISPHFDHIAAALVEVGNMRNPKELQKITSEKGQQAIADLLADRIESFYKTMPPVTEPSKLPKSVTPLVPIPQYPFTNFTREPFSPFLPVPTKDFIIRGK